MSAILSDCGRYRYRLDRDNIDMLATDGPRGVVIMVNPSTADAQVDDATIRKLNGFASVYGWSGFTVGNLFAWRATDVSDLPRVEDPVGPDNDAHLRQMIDQAGQLVFAWGASGKLPPQLRDRWRVVHAMAIDAGKTPHAIGARCSCGSPRHPLMTAYSSGLTPWAPRSATDPRIIPEPALRDAQ